MIVFDIDDTISPTRPPKDWDVEHETHNIMWGAIKIPVYILDFLRSRDDIALLSTWGSGSQKIADGFGFKAKILLIDEEDLGVDGKYHIIQDLGSEVTAWIDDHMTTKMMKALEAEGVTVIKPRRGVITEQEIDSLRNL